MHSATWEWLGRMRNTRRGVLRNGFVINRLQREREKMYTISAWCTSSGTKESFAILLLTWDSTGTMIFFSIIMRSTHLHSADMKQNFLTDNWIEIDETFLFLLSIQTVIFLYRFFVEFEKTIFFYTDFMKYYQIILFKFLEININ